MSESKLIVVLGATGAQGGSVIDALLKDGKKWKIRAVSRDPTSEKSKALASKGVEVVKGEMSDTAAIEKSFEGAYGVFSVTAFWDPSFSGKELQIGTAVNEAAKKAGVKHYVFSSLENAEEHTHGKWDVPHFTDKDKIAKHAVEIGLQCTFVQPSFYYQNFQYFFPPRKDDKGNLVYAFPLEEDKYLTAMDINDYGEAVHTAFNNPQEYIGKKVQLAGEHAHPQDYIKTIAKVTGKPAVFQFIPREVFGKLGFPGAHELAEMFGYFSDCTYFGPKSDLESGKKANPHLKSFEEWVVATGYSPQ